MLFARKSRRFLIIIGIFISVLVVGLIVLAAVPYPELDRFMKTEYSSVITDRAGDVLWVAPVNENGLRREYSTLQEIPEHVLGVFIASEDKRFYTHPGVDLLALFRSLYLNIKAGEIVSGASTITMQLAGLIEPHERTVWGKMNEAVNAFRLELRLSKDEILELWLNAIPFGFQAEGIQTASKTFFSKPVWQLTPSQALVLSVIPRSPAVYNPFQRPDNCLEAALAVAREGRLPMGKQSIQTALSSVRMGGRQKKAPHFVRYALREKNASTGPGSGEGKGQEEEDFDRRGLSGPTVVKTSLDLELTEYVRNRIAYYVDRYRSSRILNGAGLVVDNNTGEILAYVGAIDFTDEKSAGQIDCVRITNKSGSCIKPFLYALALEKGFLPNTILPDIPMTFGKDRVYEPQNFDNRFHGPVRLRVALASSLNVPAVYLLEQVGRGEFEAFLVDLGFESVGQGRDEAGIGLAVGNGEVTLLELVRGFAAFPRRGSVVALTSLLDSSNSLPSGEKIITTYTADIICDILSDHESRYLGFGNSRVFDLGFPVMYKTGTADQFQDIWALAATTDYTAGIWMGNVHGETIIGRTGSSIPAKIAGDILSTMRDRPESSSSDEYPSKRRGPGRVREGAFPVPAGSHEVTICTLSGGAPNEWCTSTLREYLPEGKQPKRCSFHRERNGKTAVVFPERYARWAEKFSIETEVQEKAGPLTIVYPNSGSVFYFDPGVEEKDQGIPIKAVGGLPAQPVRVVVNGEIVDTVSYPYRWFLPVKRGDWKVTFVLENEKDTVFISIR